jgi:polyisoprenyl-phosphate glycosyltransferase
MTGLDMKPLISIVSPVYKAEECIAELCSRIKNQVETITANFEVILVDDRSPDKSWEKILIESGKDNRIRGIRLSKNFGQHRSITAGIDIAQGDWVVVMDCDLQDPPEGIPELYKKAKEGYEMVTAYFEERAESSYRQKVSKGFWNILSSLAGLKFDYRIGNFRIMSRKVVLSFRQYREQLRLLGGITNLMGFTSTTLALKREARFAGESSYDFIKLLSVSFDIIMAYSDKPLKVSMIVGALISIMSLLSGSIIFFLAVLNVITVPGWASVMISIYFMSGVIIANLGIVGYYIGKIFEEAKKRPLYIIESDTDYQRMNRSECFLETKYKPGVIWITGLSASGKTTLAKKIVETLRNCQQNIVYLDGDELRSIFSALQSLNLEYGREARKELALQYGQLCKKISEQGMVVVIATISLFKEVHQWNRENIQNYFEVYLKVPVEVLRQRDPKGIYRKFDTGELENVAGLDLAIDEPENPDLVFEYDESKNVEDMIDIFLNKFNNRNSH